MRHPVRFNVQPEGSSNTQVWAKPELSGQPWGLFRADLVLTRKVVCDGVLSGVPSQTDHDFAATSLSRIAARSNSTGRPFTVSTMLTPDAPVAVR